MLEVCVCFVCVARYAGALEGEMEPCYVSGASVNESL